MGQVIVEMLVHIEGHRYNVAAKNYDAVVRSCAADDVQPMLRYVHKICGHLDRVSIDFLAKLPLEHLKINDIDFLFNPR